MELKGMFFKVGDMVIIKINDLLKTIIDSFKLDLDSEVYVRIKNDKIILTPIEYAPEDPELDKVVEETLKEHEEMKAKGLIKTYSDVDEMIKDLNG